MKLNVLEIEIVLFKIIIELISKQVTSCHNSQQLKKDIK